VRKTPRSRKAWHTQFIVLPEAAHSINWEKPEALNRNALELIRAH